MANQHRDNCLGNDVALFRGNVPVAGLHWNEWPLNPKNQWLNLAGFSTFTHLNVGPNWPLVTGTSINPSTNSSIYCTDFGQQSNGRVEQGRVWKRRRYKALSSSGTETVAKVKGVTRTEWSFISTSCGLRKRTLQVQLWLLLFDFDF